MKSTISFVCALLLIGCAFAHPFRPMLSPEQITKYEACMDELGYTKEKFFTERRDEVQPEERNRMHTCSMACHHEVKGEMDKNKINVDAAYESAKKILPEVEEKIGKDKVQACADESEAAGDKCQVAGSFMRCMAREMQLAFHDFHMPPPPQ